MLHGEWAISEGGVDEVNCDHGDLRKFPNVPLHIKFKGKMHTVKAADNSRLSPISGNNLPGMQYEWLSGGWSTLGITSWNAYLFQVIS